MTGEVPGAARASRSTESSTMPPPSDAEARVVGGVAAAALACGKDGDVEAATVLATALHHLGRPDDFRDDLNRRVVEGVRRLLREGRLRTASGGPSTEELGLAASLGVDGAELGRRLAVAAPLTELKGAARAFAEGRQRERAHWAVGAEAPWDPPLPLGRDRLVAELSAAPLPGWLRDYALAQASATETPVTLHVMLGLGTIAAIVCRHVWARPRPGWGEPVNLYLCPVLSPAERKSAAVAAYEAPLQAFQARRQVAQAPALARLREEGKIVEARLVGARKRAATEKADWARAAAKTEALELAAELSRLAVPEPYALLLDDATPETVGSFLADQGGRAAVFSAEGTLWEVVAGRYTSNGAPNIDVLLKAHSGDTIDVRRKGRPHEHVGHPALTMVTTIQPDLLVTMGSRPGFRGRGLLARVLWGVPAPRVGHRQSGQPPVPPGVAAQFRATVDLLAEGADALDEPVGLRFTPEADAALLAFERELEPRLAADGDLGAVADWGGKLAGELVRIATLLHIAALVGPGTPLASALGEPPVADSRADQGGGAAADAARAARADLVRQALAASPVPLGAMAAALTWEEPLIGHARAAFDALGADAALAGARRLWEWIEARDSATFTRRDAYLGLRSWFGSSLPPLDAALAVLCAHGHIREQDPAPRPPGAPGRPPSPVFNVSPLAGC